MTQGDTLPPDPTHPGEYLNSVFRLYKYPVTYAAFTGRTLFPGNYIEKYPTSVENGLNQVPSSFELFQNYPNPFNPSTVIRFLIGMDSYTSLRVFDVLGREVAILVNEKKPAGPYYVQWNTEGVPNGVYFYQLQAGSFSQTKKMLLLK
jgi:hypothetical protein